LDLPVNYKTAEGYSYQPKNYSTEFKQEVSIAEALSQSINIPAIKLLEKV
jgi:membrane carboxypeptidase/penicillin-binding protein PbpC